MATPIKLTSLNGFKTKDSLAIAKVINPLVANAFALYVKTKNFHWHMSGSHFRDYHLLLDEHADQILSMVDVLAERVRKLGETTIRSIGHIQDLQGIKDDNAPLEPDVMLEHLMHDNKYFVTEMRNAHHVCSDKQDFATTSILEEFIDQTERRTWFLFETLSK